MYHLRNNRKWRGKWDGGGILTAPLLEASSWLEQLSITVGAGLGFWTNSSTIHQRWTWEVILFLL